MSRKLVHDSTYFSRFCSFTDINDCIGVSCSGNGNCSDRVDGYICFCNSGFFGINCEVGKASHISPHPIVSLGYLRNPFNLTLYNLIWAIHQQQYLYILPPPPFLLSPPLHSAPVTQATQSVGMYKIATAYAQGSRFLDPIIAKSQKRI